MHRTAYVSIYDVLDRISVTVAVRDHDRILDGDHVVELSTGTLIPSTGEAEPIEWLQQALLGLLESL